MSKPFLISEDKQPIKKQETVPARIRMDLYVKCSELAAQIPGNWKAPQIINAAIEDLLASLGYDLKMHPNREPVSEIIKDAINPKGDVDRIADELTKKYKGGK